MSNGTPPPQPFYTSKTFWSLIVAFAINLASQLLPSTISDTVAKYANEALVLLGIYFRWSADQPLAITGGVKLSPPSG